MLPHQQRVIDEKAELDAKISKLTEFIGGAIFKGLAENEKLLLKLQASAMVMYSAILDTRIETF